MAVIDVDRNETYIVVHNGAVTPTRFVLPSVSGVRYVQREIEDNALMVTGRFERRQPSNIVVALRTNSFYDQHWKDKTHLITGNASVGYKQTPGYDLGNVLTTQIRDFRIYNARERSSVIIQTLLQDSVDGITISDATVPQVLNNRSSKLYSLTISPIGPPIINGLYTFSVGGHTFTVYLTGSRTIVLAFEPQSPATETLEYLTGIVRAKSGTERRQSMRDIPRMFWSHVYRHRDDVARLMESLTWPLWDQAYALPIWRDGTVLTAQATAGGVTLNVLDASNRDFRFGGGDDFALLWTNSTTFEAVQISNIAGNVFTAAQALLATWPAGTIVYPLRRVDIIGDELQQGPFMGRARDWTLRFQVIGQKETPSTSGFPTTYKTLPVFLDQQLNATNQFGRSFARFLDRYDAETGRIGQNSYANSPAGTWAFLARPEGRAAYWRIRQFVQALRGRQKAFWLPTGLVDFRVGADGGAPSATLSVQNVGYSARTFPIAGNRRKDIVIEYTNGTRDLRAIIAAADAGVNETLTLDSATSLATTAASVKRISFLQRVRLATDALEFTHNRIGDVVLPLAVTDVEA